MHGYEIMTDLAERSGGMWRPSPGSVYPTLQLLEDEDLVRGDATDGKRVYRLTDAGVAEAARVTALGAPWTEVGEGMGEHHRGLRTAMGQFGTAVLQVESTGTDAQVEAARAVLDDARKAVYRILAE